VDSRAALLKGGKSGPAIVPGAPAQSLLIQVVAHTHARLKMPPTGKLDPQDVANLDQWVKEGAIFPESRQEFFLSKVAPVLRADCAGCHGDSAQGGLRVDSLEALLKGGRSGPAIVPGDPDRSLLIQAVHQSGSLKMPPAGKISGEAIANLSQWIKDGAAWVENAKAGDASVYVLRPDQKAFWSFQPVRKQAAPAADRPDWNRNPIDQFIYAKLKEKGLKPGRKADRATLLRRATFDLTGLPPAREDIAAFVNDPSPGAFEKRVDRMLTTQQYGERWGRHWLDLVRYADTAGDAADFPIPEMYKYRNYVIQAFVKDKPYDQFLREQIAGDFLPASSEEQRWEQTVATGYITVSRRVGVSPKADRHVTLEDTIGNLGQTMLGLSVGCARCHDHKFDPIPTADYYALYGILDSTTYPFSGEEHNPYRGDFVYRVGKEKAADILKPFDDAFAPWQKREREKFNEYQSFQDKKILTPGRSREVVWKELTQIRQDLVPFAEAYPALERHGR
jgi:cytochrome c553